MRNTTKITGKTATRAHLSHEHKQPNGTR